MPSFYLAEATPGPDWVHTAYEALERELCLEYFGDDDSIPAEVARNWHHDETHGMKGLVLALAGDAPAQPAIGRYGLPLAPEQPAPLLAATQVYLPTVDNAHLLDTVSVLVRPDARRSGIGTAVVQAVHRLAAAHGRDTLVGFSWHREDDPSEQLSAAEGTGTIPRDAASRFAQSQGYELAQVERQSRLALPVPPELGSQLRAEAEAHALPAYRIESWAGFTPEHLRDGVAAVQAALSTDAPLGEVDWQPEVWDAERLHSVEERKLRTATVVTTVAIEAVTGEVVALTNLTVPNARPDRAEQDTTVVIDGHRGHRLGMLVKLANLQALAGAIPQCRLIDTWNASENDAMLAINVALGFRPYTQIGIWQRRLA